MMSIRSMRRLTPAILALAWCVAPTASHAASCAVTAASLKGWYGLLVSGQSTAATPVASFEAGAVLFDGVGTLSGSNIYGGAGSHNSLTGTYAVNSDCTVTLATKVGSTAAQYTVALKATGEAVGIETDAAAVSSISLRPQYATYTPGLNFTTASLNGTFAASCGGFLGAYSDVNLVVFNNGSLTGTDPYNNDGSFVAANNPYTGTYTVNSDGTFAGTLVVSGTPFDYYGVITTSNTAVEYFYANVANGAPTNAIAACTGSVAPTNTVTVAPSSFTLASSPATVTVTPPTCLFIFCFGGSSAADTVTVSPVNGFTGTVSFAVAGLPSGVSASFSPATVAGSGSTRLTLTPGSGTASGQSTTLTITGTSGSNTASTKLTLQY